MRNILRPKKKGVALIDMVRMPGNSDVPGIFCKFTMGDNSITMPIAAKEHIVTLTKGFYMGECPVTQGQWYAVMGDYPGYFTDSPEGNRANLPVERVSWYDVIVFCNKLSVMEGLPPVYSIGGSADTEVWIADNGGGIPADNNPVWNAVTMNMGANGYRLPTEAEWEYACRAGTTTQWYTGDTEDAAFQGAAWYNGNSGGRTHEVGKKKANAWGLYDMHGNVQELCWDCPGPYGEDETDPLGVSGTGTQRVFRGGCWDANANTCRSAVRNSTNPWYKSNALGFRVARSAP